MPMPTTSDRAPVSLCETLDRVLNKGAVVAGEIVISVAEVELLYLNLQLTLTSVETANKLRLTIRPRQELLYEREA
jgi:hypothetical protein